MAEEEPQPPAKRHKIVDLAKFHATYSQLLEESNDADVDAAVIMYPMRSVSNPYRTDWTATWSSRPWVCDSFSHHASALADELAYFEYEHYTRDALSKVIPVDSLVSIMGSYLTSKVEIVDGSNGSA